MSFLGDPGTTTIHQGQGTAAAKPPGFKFAQWLYSQLPQLMNTPFPTYQGKLDPGLSPTLQDTIRRAQGYAQSSPPEILAGVQGTLGRYMNPSYINPWHALFNGGGGAGGAGGAGGGRGAGMGAGMGGGNGMDMGSSGKSPNPWNAGDSSEMFGGAPNYMQIRPDQRVWGGGNAGGQTWNLPPPPPPQVPQPNQTWWGGAPPALPPVSDQPQVGYR